MQVTLTRNDESVHKEYPIKVDRYVIGRDHSCNLRIDHGRISRNHCRILLSGDRVLVEALYSAAGTAVNQTVLDPNRPPVEVHDGDHLWVGPEHFQFRIDMDAPGHVMTSAPEREALFDNVAIANPLLTPGQPANPLLKNTTTRPYRSPLPALVTQKRHETAEDTDDDATDLGTETYGVEDTEELGTLVVTEKDGVVLVRLLKKAIVTEADIRAISDPLRSLIDAGQNRITLHFGKVERLSSEVLGEVFQVHRRCKAQGGLLKICRVSPQVASVFALTNLQRHIEIFPDETQALKSVWPPPVQKIVASPPRPPTRDLEPARPPTTRVQLVVEVGRARGKTLDLNVPEFLIGRDKECHLRPNCNEVSRLHAAIEQREGRVFVRDLGSTAGTYLNGQILRDEDAEARHGDRLQIEALQFTISITRPTTPAPSSTAANPFGELYEDTAPADPNASTSLIPLPNLPPVEDSATGSTRKRDRGHQALTLRIVNGVKVLSIMTADLGNEDNISAVRAGLEAIPIDPGSERRILNLEHVSTISKGAVVMLLARAQQHQRAGATLRVCQIEPRIQTILDATQLPNMLDIYPTLQDALNAPWNALDVSPDPAEAGSV